MASVHDTYLESRILTAEPIELVRILYGLAIDKLNEAIRCLETGDLAARAKALSQASQAIAELERSLDMEAGGELSARLAGLYQYMQLRLLEGNYHQDARPWREVVGLLTTLLEAWQNIYVPATSLSPEPSYPTAVDPPLEALSATWSA